MSDIEWPASELQAEVDRLRAALDEQRERIDSARHALSGGLTIRHYREENKRLRKEANEALVSDGGKVDALRAKLSEEQTENGRLCAENTCLENSVREMQAIIKRLACELENTGAEVSRLARGHVEAVEAGRNFLGYAHTNRWGHGVDSEGGYACIDPVSRLVPSIKEANERAQRVASAPWDIVAVYKVP